MALTGCKLSSGHRQLMGGFDERQVTTSDEGSSKDESVSGKTLNAEKVGADGIEIPCKING